MHTSHILLGETADAASTKKRFNTFIYLNMPNVGNTFSAIIMWKNLSCKVYQNGRCKVRPFSSAWDFVHLVLFFSWPLPSHSIVGRISESLVQRYSTDSTCCQTDVCSLPAGFRTGVCLF